MTDDAKELVAEKRKHHGDWMEQASCARLLKGCARDFYRDKDLDSFQVEAIEMILTKISRIICGDPSHPDHWLDIQGYAYLGKGGPRPVNPADDWEDVPIAQNLRAYPCPHCGGLHIGLFNEGEEKPYLQFIVDDEIAERMVHDLNEHFGFGATRQ